MSTTLFTLTAHTLMGKKTSEALVCNIVYYYIYVSLESGPRKTIVTEPPVFVSYSHCDKVPHTGWLYCITVLGPRSLKSRSFRIGSYFGLQGELFYAPPLVAWYKSLTFLVYRTYHPYLSFICTHAHDILCACVYLCALICLFIRTFFILIRDTPNSSMT